MVGLTCCCCRCCCCAVEPPFKICSSSCRSRCCCDEATFRFSMDQKRRPWWGGAVCGTNKVAVVVWLLLHPLGYACLACYMDDRQADRSAQKRSIKLTSVWLWKRGSSSSMVDGGGCGCSFWGLSVPPKIQLKRSGGLAN